MHKHYTINPLTAEYFKKKPELCYIQHDENLKVKSRTIHAHDFWQFEYVVSGTQTFKSKRRKTVASSGDCILIAPGLPHSVIYGDENQCSWSIKFLVDVETSPERIIRLERTDASMNARSKLLDALSGWDATNAAYISIQYQLGLLLELELQRNEVKSSSYFVTQVKELIEGYQGMPIAIKELADQLKCSRNNISQKFHNETGVTLKSYIDKRRGEIAEKMLLYSGMQITTIAEIMGFADIYSFSKFFRHQHGSSPRQYRNNVFKGSHQ